MLTCNTRIRHLECQSVGLRVVESGTIGIWWFLLGFQIFTISVDRKHYRILGFSREDFNLAICLIRNIKICEVFVMLHFVTR